MARIAFSLMVNGSLTGFDIDCTNDAIEFFQSLRDLTQNNEEQEVWFDVDVVKYDEPTKEESLKLNERMISARELRRLLEGEWPHS